MLGRLGRDILAVQRARVARDTGALAAGLSSQLEREQYIRLRVGLIGSPGRSRSSRRKFEQTGYEARNLGDIYYGRFVEFGVSAQTVAVTRGRKRAATGRSYRKNGRSLTVGAPYKMKVAGQQARPFVELPDSDLDQMIANRIADFWADTFAKAGA